MEEIKISNFEEKFNHLMDYFQNNNFLVDENAYQLAKETLKEEKYVLKRDEYYYLLYALSYPKQSKTFSAIMMKKLKEYSKYHPRLEEKLNIKEQVSEQFIVEHTKKYNESKKTYYNRLLILNVILGTIGFLVLYFGLKVNIVFVTLAIVAVFCWNQCLRFEHVWRSFVNQQLSQMSIQMDEDEKELHSSFLRW